MRRLNWKLGNRLFFPLLVLFALICWKLAFSKTASAILAYRALQQQKDGVEDPPGDIILLRKREAVADSLMQAYRLDSLRWRDSLWLKSSGIAFSRKLKVIYKQETKIASDTADQRIICQSVTYCGPFSDQLVLLDSLERTGYVGHIRSVEMQNVKSTAGGEDKSSLTMRVVFSIIKK